MGFRMWDQGVTHTDFKFLDSVCEEQFLISGVDIWLYAYEGPDGNKCSTDATKPDYRTLGSQIDDIGNYVWMETPDRKYSVDAITLPMTYQEQDSTMDLMLPGLFLFNTMDIALPYTLMLERVGRKIMEGDVIEMPHYRDDAQLDPAKVTNRFYKVHDSFFAADGYSPIYTRHIWKLRLVPLTDSPEFKDILGSGKDSLSEALSTREKELGIMDLIIGQADAEVPYIHWDNEQVFTNEDTHKGGNIVGTHDNARESQPPKVYTEWSEPGFPTGIANDAWILKTEYSPPIFWQAKVDPKTGLSTWRQFVYGGRQPYVGPDQTQADFLNNRDSYVDHNGNKVDSKQSIHDVIVKPKLDC